MKKTDIEASNVHGSQIAGGDIQGTRQNDSQVIRFLIFGVVAVACVVSYVIYAQVMETKEGEPEPPPAIERVE